jgi:exodeoxyribonuclease V beta subunit
MKMPKFDVLDRKLDLNRHYLIDASAGTGKTFSIENIVVRLLLQNHQISLSEILVVTFTNAATRDLKQRIRSNIERVLDILNHASNHTLKPETLLFDYLASIIEQGAETVLRAKKRLEEAYFVFDQAQVFTIHSFCSRMLQESILEGDIALNSAGIDQTVSDHELLKIIKDFFRTGIRKEIYSPNQLAIVLSKHGNKLERLEKALLEINHRGLELVEPPTFSSLFNSFKTTIQSLDFQPEKILADFEKQVSNYKQVGNLQEAREKVKFFSTLFAAQEISFTDFDRIIKEGLFLLEVLNPASLKLRTSPLKEPLNYPDLLDVLRKKLLPIVEQARSELFIFARMAYDCQRLINHYLVEEEKMRFDDLLKKMETSVQNQSFVNRIQKTFKFAIIDEFQDTDPTQWNIFRKTFLDPHWQGKLYLVGDPKQSIYGFRQADIYTYLSAADSIDKSNHVSLDTNFRSQPSLIKALNTFFDDQNTPGFIPLPKTGDVLCYPQVQPSDKTKQVLFNDGIGSLHFLIAKSEKEKLKKFPLEEIEKKAFLPFLTQEIQKLHAHNKFNLSSFAVLVRDRFQGERVASFLKQYEIPVALQRHNNLSESCALPNLRELLNAILHGRDESVLKIALGGQIIAWSHEKILALNNDQSLYDSILKKFYSLRHLLFNQGIAQCMEELMKMQFCESRSIQEKLLASQEGIDFYLELQQLIEQLIVHQSQTRATPQALLKYLIEMENFSTDAEDIRGDHQPDAVQILSMHSSKGLEFDLVFALGLVSRTQPPDQLVPILEGSKQKLKPIIDLNSPDYLNYCHECDAEKIRQLYVTMTRAKYRLYVPLIFTPGMNLAYGTASPLELYLARLNQPMMPPEELYERIKTYTGDSLMQLIERFPDAQITFSDLTKATFVIDTLKPSEKPPLLPPKIVSVPGKAQFMYSFTSLAKSTPHETISSPLENFTAEKHEVSELPLGAEVGVILHHILELIPFHSSEEEIKAFVKDLLIGGPLEDYEREVSQLIYQGLNTPLNHQFCLSEIPSDKLIREMEFLYPSHAVLKIEGFENHEGFLKGVIDLIFEYRGKYYLADWKSNWLGPKLEDYGSESLQRAMEEHDYFLQASIYKEALRRYLKLVDPRPFEECFGGVFYLFLRGLSPLHGMQYGVFTDFSDQSSKNSSESSSSRS